MTTVAAQIASKLAALRSPSISDERRANYELAIATLVREFLPSGSGFDVGTQFDIDANINAKADRLTFCTSFHHMNDHGSYDGWTDHKVIVWPTWQGIDLRVTGRDRNAVKEYIADTFYEALMRPAY